MWCPLKVPVTTDLIILFTYGLPFCCRSMKHFLNPKKVGPEIMHGTQGNYKCCTICLTLQLQNKCEDNIITPQISGYKSEKNVTTINILMLSSVSCLGCVLFAYFAFLYVCPWESLFNQLCLLPSYLGLTRPMSVSCTSFSVAGVL